jgi:SAM-dependent methyltransferase
MAADPVTTLVETLAPGPLDAGALTSVCTGLAHESALLARLERSRNCDPDLEVALVRLRRELVGTRREAGVDAARDRVAAALAFQASINEYVWYESADETPAVLELQQQLDLAPTPVEALRQESTLLGLAMYRSLQTLRLAPGLSEVPDRDVPLNVRPLIQRELRDRAHEAAMLGDLPSFGRIENPVSQAVRAQYEAHPYPYLLDLPRRPPTPLADHVSRKFRAPILQEIRGRARVLVPGCGTGRHPLSLAIQHPDADVVAVDLSRASLARAMRTAREYGIGNVSFLQADILDLPDLGGEFDFIDCVGVIHHMEDPSAGASVMRRLLRPNGWIRLSVYGAWARAPIAICRNFLETQGYVATAESMRAARWRLLTDPGLRPLARAVLNSADFYSLSTCRDLCFHTHERAFTIPELEALVETAGLALRGIRVTGAADIYRDAFPDDARQMDPARWKQLEADARLLGCGGLVDVWATRPVRLDA